MINPNNWDKKQLYAHLQAAAEVEFWTIPLYLTALYSIKGLKEKSPKEYPLEAKLILSVVIQEMLHLELIANVSNALGYTPVLKTPQYDAATGIPYLHTDAAHLPPELSGFQAVPGPLSEATLKLFCAIELPAPVSNDWANKTTYSSIADMYNALRVGIEEKWDDLYVGTTKNTRQKSTFDSYRTAHHGDIGFSQTVNSLEEAMQAIDAIVEQGEGADVAGHVPIAYQPKADINQYDPGDFKGEWSHYHKFHFLLDHADHLSETYETNAPLSDESRAKLTSTFDTLVDSLNTSFSSEGNNMSPEFWTNMDRIQEVMCAVWESGSQPVL